MKQRLYLFFSLCAGILLLTPACKKSENLDKPLLELEGETWTPNEVDTWLYDNFTKPYNMEVKYRWDASETSIAYALTPPSLDKVRPIMEAVKKAWIEVYISQVGEAFIKKYAPKQYLLVGSLRYNTNSVTLGEAEDGLKVTLFGVDAFDNTDRAKLKRVMKTIHHEFTHILNQQVVFPVEFRQVTPGLYTANWTNIALTDARNAGFVTSYAMADPLEDFAEMVSIMITEGRDGFDAIKNSITNVDAKNKLINKENMVATYMKQVWDIDIYATMDKFREVLDEMAPIPPPLISTQLGVGKPYTALAINPATLTGLSADFTTAFNAANTHLGTLGNVGRFIESATLYFNYTDTMRLRIIYRNPTAPTSIYNGDFNYKMNLNTNTDEVDLTYLGPPVPAITANNNGRVIETYVKELTQDYMPGNYKLYWPGGAPATAAPYYAGFMKTNNVDSYFFGVLGN